MVQKISKVGGFYKKKPQERLDFVQIFANLKESEIALLKSTSNLTIEKADKIIENVISTFSLPLGIATNFKINDKDYLIPMVTEEPSVIAAACNAAKLARLSGGFFSENSQNVMIGQIVLKNITNIQQASQSIERHAKDLLMLANKKDPKLIELGGGAIKIETYQQLTTRGEMLEIQLHVDVKDAMGANIINTMTENIATEIEKITGGKTCMCIVSNLATQRITKANATWTRDQIGQDVIDGILDLQAFANANQFRSTTHNKGIMNGISAVAIATGNDFRALEAGAHSFAAYKKPYGPLTNYEQNSDGDLVGKIEIPLAVGIIGGATQCNPISKVALKILGVKTASELAGVMVSVGLAQNFAALKAIAQEGIQKGHMRLHLRKDTE